MTKRLKWLLSLVLISSFLLTGCTQNNDPQRNPNDMGGGRGNGGTGSSTGGTK